MMMFFSFYYFSGVSLIEKISNVFILLASFYAEIISLLHGNIFIRW